MLALMVGVFECDDCGKIAWLGIGRRWRIGMSGCGLKLIEGLSMGGLKNRREPIKC